MNAIITNSDWIEKIRSDFNEYESSDDFVKSNSGDKSPTLSQRRDLYILYSFMGVQGRELYQYAQKVFKVTLCYREFMRAIAREEYFLYRTLKFSGLPSEALSVFSENIENDTDAEEEVNPDKRTKTQNKVKNNKILDFQGIDETNLSEKEILRKHKMRVKALEEAASSGSLSADARAALQTSEAVIASIMKGTYKK